MGTCLGARIASSLSSRVKSERLIGWPSISPRLLRLFGGAFQFRHAGLDVLNLDSLGPMRQDQVGGPQLRGRRCVLVQHDLQDGGNRCTGRLLESRRALPERFPARLPIGLVELGFLHPSQQRVDPNTRRAGSFLHAAVRQQGRDGLLLLASEFGAVSYHLHPMHPPGPPAKHLIPVSSPRSIYFKNAFTFRCFRVMDVMTAQSAAPRRFKMTFTIDSDNNITAHGTPEEAAAATTTPFDSFASQKELVELAKAWPAERLVAIFNSLTGVTPVESFKSNKAAVSRIWQRIQGLGDAAQPEAEDAK